MPTIKTNSVQKSVSTANKVTPKKAPQKSESVILKTQINSNWKDATRSLSALVKYCNGEGKSDIQKMLDATNKKEGTKVNIKQVANIKELATIWHLPSEKVKTSSIVWGTSVLSEPPENLPIITGKTASSKRYFCSAGLWIS